MPACLIQATRMKNILTDYATSIGLRINFHKSTLIPINTTPDLGQNIAKIFGCVVGSMPFTYLGLPLGTTRPTVQDLMLLVYHAERSIPTSMSIMSKAGKLSLLNSLITSLIIYTMGTLKLPPKVLEQLDKIRRHCLWIKKTNQGEKSNSLAAWDLVCRPKQSGGLGVINLQVQNDALLLKFLHKFYNKHDIPWVQLLWDTYYTNRIPHAVDPCGSFWWRDIMHLSPIFRGVTTIQVQNGKTILFWKDSWQDNIVADTYPRAYSFSLHEDMSVKDFLSIQSLNAAFHLPLSPQALQELRQLQTQLAETGLSSSAHDQWTYIWGAREFKSKDYYKFFFKDVPVHDAFKWLWKCICTPKIKVFGGPLG